MDSANPIASLYSITRIPLGLPRVKLPVSLNLALLEVWRNKSRFFLISTVVAFITLLVLFTAGIAEGLGLGNREYIQNLRADALVYSDKSESFISASRIGEKTLRDLRAISGVDAVGAIGWAPVAILTPNSPDALKVQMGGVIPGQPGEPRVVAGAQLDYKRGNVAIIDRTTALRTGLKVDDKFLVRSVVARKDELYEFTVVGLAGSEQYSLQPTIFVPYQSWEKSRPRAQVYTDISAVTFNVALIKFADPANGPAMRKVLAQNIDEVLVLDKQSAWENTPGYGPQQSTLLLQRVFTLIIALIVVASFFRIQTLQKVAQVGVLKAIGTPNSTIVIAALAQIFVVTAVGVLLGVIATLVLAAFIPAAVPIRLESSTFAVTVLPMLLIGPLGGLVSIQILLKTEPLTALGLAP